MPQREASWAESHDHLYCIERHKEIFAIEPSHLLRSSRLSRGRPRTAGSWRLPARSKGTSSTRLDSISIGPSRVPATTRP